MATDIVSRFKNAWNVFLNRDPTKYYKDVGFTASYRQDKTYLSPSSRKTIISSVFNRIALDVAGTDIRHVRVDENGRYVDIIDSPLNECFALEANIDQTGRAFVIDIVLSMLDEGVVAIVPIDTDRDPEKGSFDIYSMRVGKITAWYPQHVEVYVYNERTGKKEYVVVPKDTVAIVENPLYAVVNEPNSTLQRLVRKLNLMDTVDERNGSGKLDLLIQLPYSTRSELRKQQAEERRKSIEDQLNGSKYGVAYIDSTEHIVQLNRPLENNLLARVDYLTQLLYSQLGITTSIMDGTADEKTMLNYYTRTIDPILCAIVESMRRVFLTKTARTQHQSILFFRDPFRLIGVEDIAKIADTFTRNEILTSNEVRKIIGMKPSDDPMADELRNKNINQSNEERMVREQFYGEGDTGYEEEQSPFEETGTDMTPEELEEALRWADEYDAQLDEMEAELDEDEEEELKHYASPYYDPVKAHEYYEAHKKLKGRTSTAGLNEKGREAAKYVKDQLTSERKTKVSEHKEQTDKSISDLREINKTAVESHKNHLNSQIESLRASLKSMSKQDRAANRERIQGQISQLREENRSFRKRISESQKRMTGRAREEHKTERTRLKNEYDEKYINELDHIKATPEFQSTRRRKS